MDITLGSSKKQLELISTEVCWSVHYGECFSQMFFSGPVNWRICYNKSSYEECVAMVTTKPPGLVCSVNIRCKIARVTTTSLTFS